jgi:hypothetical protein
LEEIYWREKHSNEAKLIHEMSWPYHVHHFADEDLISDSPPPRSLERFSAVSKGKLDTKGRIIELESLDEGRELEG